MPSNGTLAEYVSVPTDRLEIASEHLTNESAALIPLAGLTAYNALINKGELHSKRKYSFQLVVELHNLHFNIQLLSVLLIR